MTNDSTTNIEFTQADFDSLDIQQLLSSASQPGCLEFSMALYKHLRNPELPIVEESQRRLLSFLMHLTSASEHESHFENRFESFDEKINLTQSEVSLLGDYFLKLEIPDLKARLGDFLLKRKFREIQFPELVEQTADAYLESAKNLALSEEAAWISVVLRIQDALEWGLKLGRNEIVKKKVVKHIVDRLDQLSPENNTAEAARLINLLLKSNHDDIETYLSFIDKAIEAETDLNSFQNSIRLRDFWETKALVHSDLRELEESRNALIQAALTYEAQAKGFLEFYHNQVTPYARAVGYLKQGLTALMRIEGTQVHQVNLKRVLDTFQKKSMSEEFEFTELDDHPFKHLVFHLEKEIRNSKDLLEAYTKLAIFYPAVESKQKVRDVVDSRINSFAYVVSHRVLRQDGGTAVHGHSLISPDPEEREAAILERMYELTTEYHQITGVSLFQLIMAIQQEFKVDFSFFFELTRHTSFVPPARAYAFARGLYAGAKGDLIVSTHLLIPQIEASLRYMIEQSGGTPFSVGSDGIQQSHLLKALLDHPNLEQILGEDFIFHLRCLLIEKFGSNMRNEVAHGFVTNFSDPRFVYLWWLSLQLCIQPLFNQLI